MLFKRIGVTLAAAVACSAGALLQAQDAKEGAGGGSESLFIPEATIELKDVANVAARIGGVIESIEIPEGVQVKKKDPIAFLYSKKAQLAVAKAEIAAKSEVSMLKANANYEVAIAKLARANNLNGRSANTVSREEVEELTGQVKVGHAMKVEATVEHDLSVAELNLAQQALEEHSIPAPFDGIVAELLKKPGDSVQEHEPVVRLVNLDTLRVFAYVPYKESFRLRQGDRAEIEPNIPLASTGDRKKYPAKVTFIDPEVQTVGEKTRRVYLEVDNKAASYELAPGMVCSATIYPRTAATAGRDVPVAPPALGKVRGN